MFEVERESIGLAGIFGLHTGLMAIAAILTTLCNCNSLYIYFSHFLINEFWIRPLPPVVVVAAGGCTSRSSPSR